MQKNQHNGFTLIEVLFAVAIVLIGFITIAQVEVYTMNVARRANNKFKATFLAQEGLEVVKSIRDMNWLQDLAWDANLGATGNTNVEYSSSAVNDVADNLYIDGSNLYTHNSAGATPTIYFRHIEIDYRADDEGATFMEVKSVVDWTEKGQNYLVSVEEHLYDWR